MRWEDVSVRARGLATHLLPPAALALLAEVPDLPALGARLAELHFGGEAPGSDAADLELLARREAGRRLRLLARWLGTRTPALAVIFEDEDRRSVRAMLRGAAAGMPAASRLSGLIPTSTLPERALEELAARVKVSELVALLSLWSHPYGSALVDAGSDPPELGRLELALHRAYAHRSVRAARLGGLQLREFVAETVDLLNAEAALLLAAEEHELAPEASFVSGGLALTREAFHRAATAGSAAGAAAVLATALLGTGFEGAFRSTAGFPSEAELLRLRIRRWRRQARLAPAGAAPLLEYLLRLRAQVLDLRSLVWAVAVGMPNELRRGLLVTG